MRVLDGANGRLDALLPDRIRLFRLIGWQDEGDQTDQAPGQGAVEPGAAFEALRDDLIEKALALRDPDTGERVIQAAYRSEEVFEGRAFDTMPDLVLHTDRAKYVSFGHADFGSRRVVEPSYGQTGHHHMEGVVVLRGPDIRRGVALEGASLLDVTPTILTHMGLPVGDDMDGNVVGDAFELPPEIKTIPSWDEVEGNDGQHPPERKLNSTESEEALKILMEVVIYLLNN